MRPSCCGCIRRIPTDWSVLARANRIGLQPGQAFDWDALDPAVRQALEDAPTQALKVMQAKLPTLAPVANGWLMNTDSIGVYGDYYLKRAIVSMVGLGANQPEDAIYPLAASDADGQPLDGDNDYVLHFTKDELPPVELAARSTRPVGRHHAAVRAPACRPPRTLGTPHRSSEPDRHRGRRRRRSRGASDVLSNAL